MVDIEKIDNFWNALTESCEKCGRDIAEITPVPETDNFAPDELVEIVDAGFDSLQETKLYKAEQKIVQAEVNADWHYMGKLKEKQIPKAVRMFSMIHFVNSMDMLKAIDAASDEAGTSPMIALEVNVVGPGGTGIMPEEIHEAADFAAGSFNVSFVGISGKPPLYMNSEASMKYYHHLALIKSQLEDELGIGLGLSIGRSDRDLDAAVSAGCNWIRAII